MMHCRIHLELPSEERTVPLCCRTAQALLEDLAVDQERAADIAMVVSEAAGSAVRRAAPHPDHLYRVTLAFYSDRVRLEVADQGCGFVPPTASQTDEQPLGGGDLWLIEQLADAMTVSVLPDGGCVLQAEFFLPSPLLLHPPIRDHPDHRSPEEDAGEAFQHLPGPYPA